jgi:hypothetical protein
VKKNKEFENILSLCFDRLLKGEAIERCLSDYPDQAKDLEPLLRTFAAAKSASEIKPRAEFKAEAKHQFQVALAELSEKQRQKAENGRWHWRWQSAWSIAVIAVLIVIFAGGGTIAAAGNSMPDSPLYSIKIAAEKVELALTPSDIGKAELNARLADRRVTEINYMAVKGNTHEVQILAQHLNDNFQNIVHLAGGDGNSETNSAASRGTLGAGATATSSGQAAFDNSQPSIVAPALTAAASAAVSSPTQPPKAAAPVTAIPGSSVQYAPEVASTSTNFGNIQGTQSQPVINAAANEESEKSQIARILIDNAISNSIRLNELLNNAPAEVKPAIRQAIAQSQVELDKALKILQGLENQVN